MVWGCSDCRRGKTSRKLLLFSSRPRRSWRYALVECTVRPTWRQSDRSATESGTSPPAPYTDRTPPTTHPTHAFPLPSTFARSLPLPPLPRTQDLSPKNDAGSDVTTGSDSPIRVGASVGGGDPGESLPVVTSLPVSFLGARTTIDVFSKYVWVIPLKNKTGPALVTAFKEILESGRKPQKIQTDEGTEFFNKHFKDLMKAEEIQLYNTYNETKASVVERVIRTLKTRMWRYFTAKKTMRYIDVLQDLVDAYNQSKHRSIQKKPINVTQENEREVWHTLYGEREEKKKPVSYKFEIGDQVRISKMKRTFEKGYLPNFSKEIFTVSQQIPREPPVYKLKDYDQEELSGTFYNE